MTEDRELHRKLELLAQVLTNTSPDEPLCNDIVAELCAYHDAVRSGAELTPEQRRLQLHLGRCTDCTEALDMLRDACEACDEPDEDERDDDEPGEDERNEDERTDR